MLYCDQADPSSRGRVRILLAGDDEINRPMASALLEEAGYSVEVAKTAGEAVAVARSGRFDLILMDVQMPQMDGFEATRLIRAFDTAAATVPIVAMTADSMHDDRARWLAAGMDDFIAKPIEAEQFLATVARVVAAGDGWGQRRDKDLSQAAQPSADFDDQRLDGLARLLPPDRFRSIVESYVAVAEERLQRMEDFAQTRNLEGIAREAHDLKGVSGSVGALRLEVLAKRLEHACKTGDVLETLALIIEIRFASTAAWKLVSARLRPADDVAA